MAIGGPHIFKNISEIVLPHLSTDHGVPWVLRNAHEKDKGAGAIPDLFPGTHEELQAVGKNRRMGLLLLKKLWRDLHDIVTTKKPSGPSEPQSSPSVQPVKSNGPGG